MKSSILLALVAVAAVGTTAARADIGEAAQGPAQFQSSRARTEVRAEAVEKAAANIAEPAGARAQPALQSTVDAVRVRLQASEALRQGLIPRGEAG